MSSIYEGVQLAKQNQYAEAICILDKQWQANNEQFSPWDRFYYSKCLRKENRKQEAVKLNRDVYKQLPEHAANNSLYAWNLFDLYVRQSVERKVELEKLLKVADFIDIVRQDNFSPYERTVFEVLKRLKEKNNPDLILYWLDKLDPDLLAIESISIVDKLGNPRELASNLELWHRYRVKAYRGTKDWQTCIDAADAALLSVPNFHYDNHIWIRIDRAISISALGEVKRAIAELESAARESSHWLAYRHLFTLYKRDGNADKAIEKAANALLSRSGELEHKIKLLEELADLLGEIGNNQEAECHRRFALSLQGKAQGSTGDRRVVEQFWTDRMLAALPQGTGVITKLLLEGKSGFIQLGDQSSIFFRALEFRGPRNKLVLQQRVSFSISESYDRKKQQLSQQAIRIRPI
jgi:tetratricopeptide (TPR) repeat protein